MKKSSGTANSLKTLILTFTIWFFLTACSTINTIVKEGIQKPHVTVEDMKVTGFDFKTIDLLFDINIDNPNSLGVKLNGFDYDFLVNDNSFIKGENSDGLEIIANGNHGVQIPVTVGFSDLFNAIKSLHQEDNSMYQMKTGFLFDVPILGSIRVPVSKSGEIPMVKLPSISLGSVKVSKLNLTGADLEVGVNINNPNGFSLNLHKMDYNLNVNGKNWVSGITNEALSVDEHGKSTLKLPVSLNFLDLGSSVFQLLSGNNELSYRFNGNVDLGSSLPMLPKANLDFDKTGNFTVSR